jgi:hypothetical protein
VGELTVLHKPTPANKVVSAQLYFAGGLSRIDATSAGIEQLALDVAADGGTEQHPKDAFHGKLDALGASIGSLSLTNSKTEIPLARNNSTLCSVPLTKDSKSMSFEGPAKGWRRATKSIAACMPF